MKFALVLVLSVFVFGNAYAGYNSDAEGHAVRCKGTQMSVVINAARTEITVINAIDSGHPEEYRGVRKSDSDGDTFTSYSSRNNEVTLTFDDQGDTLTYKGQSPIKLHCPN